MGEGTVKFLIGLGIGIVVALVVALEFIARRGMPEMEYVPADFSDLDFSTFELPVGDVYVSGLSKTYELRVDAEGLVSIG